MQEKGHKEEIEQGHNVSNEMIPTRAWYESEKAQVREESILGCPALYSLHLQVKRK